MGKGAKKKVILRNFFNLHRIFRQTILLHQLMEFLLKQDRKAGIKIFSRYLSQIDFQFFNKQTSALIIIQGKYFFNNTCKLICKKSLPPGIEVKSPLLFSHVEFELYLLYVNCWFHVLSIIDRSGNGPVVSTVPLNYDPQPRLISSRNRFFQKVACQALSTTKN